MSGKIVIIGLTVILGGCIIVPDDTANQTRNENKSHSESGSLSGSKSESANQSANNNTNNMESNNNNANHVTVVVQQAAPAQSSNRPRHDKPSKPAAQKPQVQPPAPAPQPKPEANKRPEQHKPGRQAVNHNKQPVKNNTGKNNQNQSKPDSEISQSGSPDDCTAAGRNCGNGNQGKGNNKK